MPGRHTEHNLVQYNAVVLEVGDVGKSDGKGTRKHQ